MSDLDEVKKSFKHLDFRICSHIEEAMVFSKELDDFDEKVKAEKDFEENLHESFHKMRVLCSTFLVRHLTSLQLTSNFLSKKHEQLFQEEIFDSGVDSSPYLSEMLEHAVKDIRESQLKARD